MLTQQTTGRVRPPYYFITLTPHDHTSQSAQEWLSSHVQRFDSLSVYPDTRSSVIIVVGAEAPIEPIKIEEPDGTISVKFSEVGVDPFWSSHPLSTKRVNVCNSAVRSLIGLPDQGDDGNDVPPENAVFQFDHESDDGFALSVSFTEQLVETITTEIDTEQTISIPICHVNDVNAVNDDVIDTADTENESKPQVIDNAIELPVEMPVQDWEVDIEWFKQTLGATHRANVSTDSWDIYDGKRWKFDNDKKVIQRHIIKAAKRLLSSAIIVNNAEGVAFAQKLMNRKNSAELAEMAQIMLMVDDPCDGYHFDYDVQAHLLNCQNGTLNLVTMELRPHRPEDHLSRITSVDFDPNAQHPIVDAFIEHVTNGDADMRKLLVKWLGLSLSGITIYRKMAIIFGESSTGKSALAQAMQKILGEDYAAVVNVESFLNKVGDGSSHSADIVRLRGMRFCSASEAESKKPLSASRIKRMTGGDLEAGRGAYEKKVIQFEAIAKFTFAVNVIPALPKHDKIMMDRIIMIPFNNPDPGNGPVAQFRANDKDPKVQKALLRIAVDGFKLLQAEGLTIPEKCEKAKAAYLNGEIGEIDSFSLFRMEKLELDPEGYITARELRTEYVEYCRNMTRHEVEVPISESDVAEILRDLGCKEGGGDARHWKGIHLKPTVFLGSKGIVVGEPLFNVDGGLIQRPDKAA